MREFPKVPTPSALEVFNASPSDAGTGMEGVGSIPRHEGGHVGHHQPEGVIILCYAALRADGLIADGRGRHVAPLILQRVAPWLANGIPRPTGARAVIMDG